MLNIKAIEYFIERDHLNEALDMLKEWDEASQNGFRKEVLNLKRRYNEISQEYQSGKLSFSKKSRYKSKLTHDILNLLEVISNNDL